MLGASRPGSPGSRLQRPGNATQGGAVHQFTGWGHLPLLPAGPRHRPTSLQAIWRPQRPCLGSSRRWGSGWGRCSSRWGSCRGRWSSYHSAGQRCHSFSMCGAGAVAAAGGGLQRALRQLGRDVSAIRGSMSLHSKVALMANSTECSSMLEGEQLPERVPGLGLLPGCPKLYCL